MKTSIALFLIGTTLCFYSFAQKSAWSSLKNGEHKVGFKTVRLNSKTNNPMLISIWYPAIDGIDRVSLQDLILVGGAEENVPDSTLIKEFVAPIEWMFEMKLSTKEYLKTIKGLTNTYRNAKQKDGKFPLVIANSMPSTYFVTFEFLASHGYVVAGVDCKFPGDSPGPPLHYSRHTDVMGELLDFMERQDYVQTSDIIAFGHGFSINPALYLAMRTTLIKKAVNFDGGFFGPRSNTTLSIDYHPERLVLPLLHVITAGQEKEDDLVQFRMLKNPITRVIIKSEDFRHQDVSGWGRLVTVGLRRGEEAERVNIIFDEVHKLMLDFLRNKPIDTDNNTYFRIEKFN